MSMPKHVRLTAVSENEETVEWQKKVSFCGPTRARERPTYLRAEEKRRAKPES